MDDVQLSLVQSVAGVYAGDWAKRINHFSEIQSETYVVTSVRPSLVLPSKPS